MEVGKVKTFQHFPFKSPPSRAALDATGSARWALSLFSGPGVGMADSRAGGPTHLQRPRGPVAAAGRCSRRCLVGSAGLFPFCKKSSSHKWRPSLSH